MKIFYHCEDCGKKLIFGVHTFYCHPLDKNKMLCQDCDLKYTKLRDDIYLEALDKAHKNVIEGFNNFITNSN